MIKKKNLFRVLYLYCRGKIKPDYEFKFFNDLYYLYSRNPFKNFFSFVGILVSLYIVFFTNQYYLLYFFVIYFLFDIIIFLLLLVVFIIKWYK